MEKKTVTLYTDGACSGNPGPGGYGGILMYGGMKKEYNGGEESTTNNRMEMRAVIEGLSMYLTAEENAKMLSIIRDNFDNA